MDSEESDDSDVSISSDDHEPTLIQTIKDNSWEEIPELLEYAHIPDAESIFPLSWAILENAPTNTLDLLIDAYPDALNDMYNLIIMFKENSSDNDLLRMIRKGLDFDKLDCDNLFQMLIIAITTIQSIQVIQFLFHEFVAKEKEIDNLKRALKLLIENVFIEWYHDISAALLEISNKNLSSEDVLDRKLNLDGKTVPIKYIYDLVKLFLSKYGEQRQAEYCIFTMSLLFRKCPWSWSELLLYIHPQEAEQVTNNLSDLDFPRIKKSIYSELYRCYECDEKVQEGGSVMLVQYRNDIYRRKTFCKKCNTCEEKFTEITRNEERDFTSFSFKLIQSFPTSFVQTFLADNSNEYRPDRKRCRLI